MSGVLQRLRRVLALAAVSVVLTSCAVGLDRIPLPAPSAGARTYPISATFANALNLPFKAKVRLSGADVGEVESMVAQNYTAVVNMRIAGDVAIPVGTRAELRSATPLGDIFVSLTPPAVPGSAAMQPGDVIPLDTTASAASIEEVLSTAALLVNGGAIRNLTKVVNGLGRAVGGKGDDLGAFLDESTKLVQSLSERSAVVKRTLAQTGELAETMSARQETIDAAIVAAAPALGTVADNTGRIVDLVAQVNRITLELAKLPSVRGEPSRSMIADLNRLSAELNAASLEPNASLDQFNSMFGAVLKVTNGTAAHVDIDLADLAVGAFADPYHPGDAGSHAPTREDFRNMVGSISYELMMVRNKFWGAPTAPPGTVPPPDLVGPAPGSLTPAPPPPPLPPPPTRVPSPSTGGTP
ncbi:MlaD family protein [Mycolicibacterium vaccae]|uniref:MlaD family protein n=1 Tax=Mycolicibacterium vaccae TaxID=1810 RepID=UPI003CF20242